MRTRNITFARVRGLYVSENCDGGTQNSSLGLIKTQGRYLEAAQCE